MRPKSPTLAKLTRPRTHRPIDRERVYHRLDEVRRAAPVIWLDGPPGAGKTTAVGTWLESRALPYRWYQVDASDIDPATFFFYLEALAAPRGGKKSAGRRLPYLTPEYLPDLPGFTHRFFRQLLALLRAPIVLVLDNLQEAGDSLFPILREAAAEFPREATLLCVSREAPPAALSRLAANGQLTRVGWEDLKLDEDESREILRARGIVAEQAKRLSQQANGWVAGLVLLSAQRTTPRPSAAEPSVTVFDYFAGEIFDRATAGIGSFLLKTAFLREITRDVAVAVTGDIRAPELLEQLHRLQYFIDRQSGESPVYRYHDLFRQFLLSRIPTLLSPEEVSQLRRKSAANLAAIGQLDEAIALYREDADWDTVRSLVREHAMQFVEAGRWQTVSAWLAALPERHIEQDAWLLYWRAVCQTMTEPVRAQAGLTSAYEHFAVAGDELGMFHSVLGSVEVVFIIGETFFPLDILIERLTPLLQQHGPFADRAQGVRAWCALLHACLHRRPDHPMIADAVAYLLVAIDDRDLGLTAKTAALSALVGYAHFSCDEHVGRHAYRLLDQVVGDEAVAPATRVWGCAWLGVYDFMAAEFASSLAHSDRTKALALRFGLASMVKLADIYRSYALYQIGDRAAAEQLDQHLAAGDAKPYGLAYALAVHANHRLLSGDAQMACELYSRTVDVANKVGFVALSSICHAFYAAALADSRQCPAARQQLAHARELFAGSINVYMDALYGCIEAWIHLQSDAREPAIAALRAGLHEARKWKRIGNLPYVRHRLPELFQLALESNIETELVTQLIRRWELSAPSGSDTPWPWPVKIYSLGPFSISVDDKPLTFANKAPRRLLELLRAIIALGTQEVPVSKLADNLFPDQDADLAAESIRVSVQRLRKLLGAERHVLFKDGRVSLSAKSVWVDANAFESSGLSADNSAQVLLLYRGDFLPQEEAGWAIATRDRLRGLFTRRLSALAEQAVASSNWREALAMYERGAEVDPISEGFCQGILRCCSALGLTAQGESAYALLSRALRAASGREPGSQTKSLLHQLHERNKQCRGSI